MSEFNVSLPVQQQLSLILNKQGLERFGIVPISPPISLEFYRTWLNEGHHGSMTYLERHLPQKENPELILKNVVSAIVVACDYKPHPQPIKTDDLNEAAHQAFETLTIAQYARGEDYHNWLQKRLESVAHELQQIYSDEHFLVATDSKPILERDLAYRAGLGWFGKNTCLIDQKHGSYFLIGEILTTMDLSGSTVRALHPDRCGTCTRCIDACPTQALIAPRKLDARKCISYLTIESKDIPDESLRSQIGSHFFGCDICQAVCPWNEKVFGADSDRNTDRQGLVSALQFILRTSNKELERYFATTPLSRARGFGLKRNAILVAANSNLKELRVDMQNYVSDPRLGELASWALARL